MQHHRGQPKRLPQAPPPCGGEQGPHPMHNLYVTPNAQPPCHIQCTTCVSHQWTTCMSHARPACHVQKDGCKYGTIWTLWIGNPETDWARRRGMLRGERIQCCVVNVYNECCVVNVYNECCVVNVYNECCVVNVYNECCVVNVYNECCVVNVYNVAW